MSQRNWPRYESMVDRKIRESIERGDFDNLPGAGKPLRDLSRDGEDWWIKAKLEREGIKAPLPTPLALRRERDALQQTLSGVRHEARAREIIEDLNERIKESYRHREPGPVIVVRLVDVEQALAEWRAARR